MKKTNFLKSEDHQRFSLRKLSVGVASVLVGTTFMVFGSQEAHAADLNGVQDQSKNVLVEKQNDQLQQNEAKPAQDSVQANQDKKIQTQDLQVNNKSQATAQSQNDSDAQVATNTFQVKANKNAVNAQALTESKAVKQEAQPTYNNPINVYDWNGLTSAIRDKNVDAIVLNNDIYATGIRETAFNKPSDWDISRKLTITSKDPAKRNTINFGNHFYSFWDQNQKSNYRRSQNNDQAWDITLKDINITNTDEAFSPFFFNNESVRQANRSKITFDNVDQNGDMLLRSEQVNVELKNNVNINDTLHNGDFNAIYARSVKIAPDANVVMNVRDTRDSWFLHGNAAIKIVGDGDENNVALQVGDGASLKINPNQAIENTKGIVIEGNSDVILGKNANVQMNMGRGNTTAIWGARNLILNENSNLDIKTLEDNHGVIAWGANNNGHHVSPITLGINKASWADNTLRIKNGASLKIVREYSGQPAIDGLISIGSYSTNAHSKQNLIVDDGATLDLQDGAQSNWHEYGNKLASYLGNKDDLYTTGLISMYGIDATNNLHFGNAKYVNLQRTGRQRGILIRLEGGSSIGGNAATIDASGIPLAQWTAGNYSEDPNYAWNLDHLYTENKWGDYSYNYNGRGQNRWVQYTNQRNNGLTFDQTTGNVQFTDGKSLYEHSDFNRVFNWWAPQRISFGTALAPQKVYKASVDDSNALTTHVNATTSTPSLNTNNIVFTWRDADGNIEEAPEGYTVAWNVSPDTSRETPVGNPTHTGNVIVTLKDGSKQTVVVPVNVLGAHTINGLVATQNDPSTIPTAYQVTDTNPVDRFGVASIDWVSQPDISRITPASQGVVRVNYSDGTSQILKPTIQVKGAQIIYHARVNDADALTTHVGANTSVPSLDPNSINFTWTNQDGVEVAAPNNYSVNWITSPDTSRATDINMPNRQGYVRVTLDNGENLEVNVPVNVLSARTQHDGYKIKQNDYDKMPTAGYMTDSSDVDHFGIDNITWAQEPNIAQAGAQVYGRVRVNYSDGTSQLLNPYLDVLQVEDGKDNPNNIDVAMNLHSTVKQVAADGRLTTQKVLLKYARTKITDLALPLNDPNRVVYTAWKEIGYVEVH